MSPLNVYQQVFSVSLCTNMIRTDKNTAAELRKLLAEKVSPVLSDIDPGWSVACSLEEVALVPIHSSRKRLYRTLVVSIAGTACNKVVIEQDSDIYHVIHPDSWASSGLDSLQTAPIIHDDATPTPEDPPIISNGFGQAAHRLINYTMFYSEEPPFGEWLKSQEESHPDTRFVIAGPSLGAALACSTAYVLTKGNVLPRGNVFVYPTAGPSPGNMAFVKSFKELFPSSEGTLAGYKHWNTNIINTLDAVPYGYCTDSSYTTRTLDKTTTMFGAPAVPFVQRMVDILITRSKGTYYPIPSSIIELAVELPQVAPKTVEEFMVAGLPQHEKPYLDSILGGNSESVFDIQGVIKTLLTQVPAEQPVLASQDYD
ncbi:Lipase (class 3) [Ceratobasidium sp. AG-Ba]|nr:Lipase (class 3) [Ceratobasidium sp. AG-Ba]